MNRWTRNAAVTSNTRCTLTSCPRTKSNLYLDSCFETVIREPALLHTFQFPKLISIFCHLDHLSKESIQVHSSVNCSVTSFFFMVKSCLPHAQPPQTGGPPTAVSLRLLIHYICSYPPLLEAIPPSATQGHAMLWWRGDPPNVEWSSLIFI
jgi:hypothetical protein